MKTIITENLQKTQRYIPHTLETRLAAVKTYRNKNSISFICRRYKVSKASLMRWNKKYDGTKGSLMDKSHKPHSSNGVFKDITSACFLFTFLVDFSILFPLKYCSII